MGAADIVWEVDSIAPNETREIVAEAPHHAPYNKLVVDTHEHFMICDITVEGETQLATDTEIPCGAFCPEAVGIRLSLGTRDGRVNSIMPIGTKVGIKIRNWTNEPHPFKARLVATTLR